MEKPAQKNYFIAELYSEYVDTKDIMLTRNNSVKVLDCGILLQFERVLGGDLYLSVSYKDYVNTCEGPIYMDPRKPTKVYTLRLPSCVYTDREASSIIVQEKAKIITLFIDEKFGVLDSFILSKLVYVYDSPEWYSEMYPANKPIYAASLDEMAKIANRIFVDKKRLNITFILNGLTVNMYAPRYYEDNKSLFMVQIHTYGVNNEDFGYSTMISEYSESADDFYLRLFSVERLKKYFGLPKC